MQIQLGFQREKREHPYDFTLLPRKLPETPMNPIDTLLTQIAQRHLGIQTLETRNSDSLDFHDVAVWSLREALAAAYKAGAEQGVPTHKAAKTRRASRRRTSSK